jgi:hypothetical protein
VSFTTVSPRVCNAGNWHVPPYYSRSSVFNRPLGDSDVVSADQTPAHNLANQIQYGRQGRAPFGYQGVGYGRYQWPASVGFNLSTFSFPIYVVDSSTPRQKVGLWNPGNPNTPFGSEYANIQQFYNAVPIPDKAMCPRITGTYPEKDIWTPDEGGCVIWARDTDEAWELYGTSNTGPLDMQQAMGCTWLARGAGYIVSMRAFNGCFANKWGARATSLGAIGGVITMQDLRDVHAGGEINHSLCIAAGFNAGVGTQVAPASRSDGIGPNNVATIPTGYPGAGGPNPAHGFDVTHEGSRYRLPADVNLSAIPATNLLGAAVARCLRTYPLMIVDTTGACALYVEDPRTQRSPYHLQGADAVDPLTLDWPGGRLFTGALNDVPWDQLQALDPVAS